MRIRPAYQNVLGRATFELNKTGNGTGVSTLRMQASANTTLELVGDANFYTDAAGTSGESKTAVIGTSVTTIYLRCATSARLIIPEQRLITHFSPTFTIGWVSGTNAASITTTKFPLRNLVTLTVTGNNTFNFSIADLPASMTYIYLEGQNVIDGDIRDIPSQMTFIRIQGNSKVSKYTQGKQFANGFNFLRTTGAVGLPQSDIINLIVDINNTTWGGASRGLTLSSPNASMANTTQGGIWGDFSGTAAPSALATAYKNLIRVQSVAVTLNGITVPGVTGDGTGFPAGFGDWYRS